MLKHVIVERPHAGRVDEFVALAIELRLVMHDRGWVHYTAWRAGEADRGEPPLFDVGILSRAVPFDEGLVVLEAHFRDRDELETQLAAMRNDPEVVNILVKAMATVDRSASRSYVLEDWWP